MNEMDRAILSLVEPGNGGDEDNCSGEEREELPRYWVEWFLPQKGREFLCDVEEEYILDRFNLTGLNTEVKHYSKAIDLITDSLAEDEMDDAVREEVEISAMHVYGLIHARYIITQKGLEKMHAKYKNGDFGHCPRVYCRSEPLLPVGLTDIPGQKSVKLYCPKCEDVYHPRSNRHSTVDGAYFGTSFPHMLLQMHPHIKPSKAQVERYVPKIFGFKIRSVNAVHRAQDRVREEMNRRVSQYINAEGGAANSAAALPAAPVTLAVPVSGDPSKRDSPEMQAVRD